MRAPNGTWNCIEARNNRITVIQNCQFALSAHLVAALWVDRQKLHFIDLTTNSSFMSVVHAGTKFHAVETTPDATVECRAVANTYFQAFAAARQLAYDEKKPFIPNFWVEISKCPK